jgi:selenocysteine lyase/cysteine desulfurase
MEPAELRDDIPAVESAIYMNTGASGPSPRRVVEAAERTLEYHEYESPANEGMYPAAWGVLDDAREAVGNHVGASAEDVALTQCTTDGIGRVAAAMEWDADDVVVRTDLEHAAGILPWRRLRDEVGVEVRTVETEDGRIPIDAYKDAVDGATLATFSSLTWTHGTRLPVAELTDIAHDTGARVLVDAVQTPGQHPLDVEAWGADAIAAASHKWLLGLWGAGFLYVSPEFAQSLTPAQLGYLSAEDPYADPYELYPNAQRFEIGTTSPAPYAALVEAVDTIEELGYDTIEAHVERLTDRLKAGLDAEQLVSPRDYESGLVSFTVDDPEGTVERLADENIHIRAIPWPDTVRTSLHVFNTAEDVDALLDAL